MPLPTCQCVNGLPTQQQLGHIYCALLDILAAQGGDITLSQISDLNADWIPVLQAPLANFSITASQILDATPQGVNFVTQLMGGDPGGSVVVIDDTGAPQVVTGITASQTPVTSVDTDRGVVTLLS